MARRKNGNGGGTANLKPWGKGQSGNPNGRPKSDVSITTHLKTIGKWPAPPSIIAQYQKAFPNLPNNATNVMVLACRNWLKAFDMKHGDGMAKELGERIDGKVPLPIGGDPNGHPIDVKFDFSNVSDKELDLLERILGKCQIPDE